jgi:flagellar basal-body rod protein FlgB
MPLSIEGALGIHDDAVKLRARRTEVLASNVANADTPNYKARDIDFRAALAQAESQQSGKLRATDARHIQPSGAGGTAEAQYRVPSQASLDGNTVDPHMEKAAFAENAVNYQTSLMFLTRKINGLRGAMQDR